MNPHLTLALSPPIGWERRGNSRRTRIVPPRSVEQRQVHGPNARQNFGVEAFQEPSPHPGPLPSHRMGAEREQETDTNCSTEVCRAAAGSWCQGPPQFWPGGQSCSGASHHCPLAIWQFPRPTKWGEGQGEGFDPSKGGSANMRPKPRGPWFRNLRFAFNDLPVRLPLSPKQRGS
jgi:hypothetical protein